MHGKKITMVLVNVDRLTDEWNQYCLEGVKKKRYEGNDD